MKPRIRTLQAELRRNLQLFFFDEESIEELLGRYGHLPLEIRRKSLSLTLAFSSISANIVPRLSGYIVDAAAELSEDDMSDWLDRGFELLDSEGIEPAVRFLSRTEPASLRAFCAPMGCRLAGAASRLESWLRAVSGRDYHLLPSTETFTDGYDIYLLEIENTLSSPSENYLLMKLRAAWLWAQIRFGTLSPPMVEAERVNGAEEGGGSALERMLSAYGERELARDLYSALEAPRLENLLAEELPGLLRDARPVFEKLLSRRPLPSSGNPRTLFVEALFRHLLGGRITEEDLPGLGRAITIIRENSCDELPGPSALGELYDLALALPGHYEPVPPLPHFGLLKPSAVSSRMLREQRERIMGLIDELLDAPELEPEKRKRGGDEEEGEEGAEGGGRKIIMIRGRLFELDEELAELLRDEEGRLPGTLVEGGPEGGGPGTVDLREELEARMGGGGGGEEEEGGGPERDGAIAYDEWDYRRGGYRKGWCSLYETPLHPSAEPFCEEAARKYAGQILLLRKKFELMRTVPGILKRQKDGDNIDLDAVVEAMADVKAGASPSEGLFTKLGQRERDIAALLLLDMSGSTKGWVNTAQKESLVLMCEAMERLGDRYAIYGFSGLTRNRCEFYLIKGFDQGYGQEVKGRIAGILPKDYTRMGPPIRHSAKLLAAEEVQTRLLIILSDGKPEDYDHYKGRYGIEDTRMALVEAKRKGIHSFCITIDEEARSYIPHMYGEVNYAFLDDVRKLPSKLTEIYRRLTT